MKKYKVLFIIAVLVLIVLNTACDSINVLIDNSKYAVENAIKDLSGDVRQNLRSDSKDDWVERIGYENFIVEPDLNMEETAIIRVIDDNGKFVLFGIMNEIALAEYISDVGIDNSNVINEGYVLLFASPDFKGNNTIEEYESWNSLLTEAIEVVRDFCDNEGISHEELIKIWAERNGKPIPCPIRLVFLYNKNPYIYNMETEKFETRREDPALWQSAFIEMPKREADALPNGVKELAKKYSLYNWID